MEYLSEQLLAKTGIQVSTAQISTWERNIYKPRPDKRLALAELFDKNVTWLMEGRGPESPSHDITTARETPIAYTAEDAGCDRALILEVFEEVFKQGVGLSPERLAEAAAEVYIMARKKKSLSIENAVKMWIS